MKKVHTALFLLTLFLGIVSVYGGTIYVPDDYKTIQEAIDAANPGNVIFVRDGVYYENLVIDKSITLRSENGPENCIIDGNNSGDVIVINADGVTIEGFTVRGDYWPDTGIKVKSNNNTIKNNNISNNWRGIDLDKSSNNSITNNNISDNYYGINMDKSSNNRITNNDILDNHYSIYLDESSNNSITNNNISKNNDDSIRLYKSNNNSIVDNNVSNNRNGIVLRRSNNNTIIGNNILNNNQSGISLEYSSNNVINSNTFINNSIFIEGWKLDHWTHIIENNIVNGKPLYYFKNQKGGNIPEDAGQVFLVNCSNMIVKNLNINNTDVGIAISYSSNITVKNCVISDNDDGIYFYKSSNNVINSNTFINNSIFIEGWKLDHWTHIIENNIVNGKPLYYFKNQKGGNIPEDAGQVFLVNCSNMIVKNLNINNTDVGIAISYSSNITVKNCVISDNDDGIWLTDSNNNIIINNNISNNRNGIYLDYSSSNNITNSNIFNNDNGIRLTDSNNNIIINNNISNNRNGIYLDYSSSNNIITNNDIFNNEDGINLWYSRGNDITNNNISNNRNGIELDRSNNNTITNNKISNNQDGICLYESVNNTITDNNISNNWCGVRLYESVNNTITDNNISNNWDGISLRYSNSNSITNNNISNNGYIIRLESSNNNKIYLNNFINNSDNVYSYNSTNLWNSAEKIIYIWNPTEMEGKRYNNYNGTQYTNYLGNYWDDYQGLDVDGDGIGDTYYQIDSHNIDYYPLIQPQENYMILAHTPTPTPSVIYVPDNYPTIQKAIDAAKDGDVIVVRDGIYYENLVVNKSITLRSENGPENCIIYGNNSEDVIVIDTDGVTIEGFTIRNSGNYSSTCIRVNSHYNNIIRNNNILNSEIGIYLYYSINNSIIGNNISNNEYGINLKYSINNSIIGNNISNNEYGINLKYSINNSIINNYISNGDYGIKIEDSSNNIIANNDVSNNNDSIYLKSSSNNNITNNNILNNIYGICLKEGSSNNIITNNKIALNSKNGIHLWWSGNNIITNNDISNNENSIYLYESKNNNIANNDIGNNGNGIYLYESGNNIINDNTFTNDSIIIQGSIESWIHTIEDNTVNGKPLYYFKNQRGGNIPKDAGQVILANCTGMVVEDLEISNTDVGIILGFSSQIKIRNNVISSNGNGMYLYESGYNSIFDNNVSNNGNGIYLYESGYNSIFDNNVSNNNKGINFYKSNNNKIYLNNFISNLYNIYFTYYYSTNLWHSPDKITYIYNGTQYTNYLGNYWSDYTGNDTDRDGIGDTSYQIDSNNIDYCPLMQPWENYVTTTPTPTPTPLIPQIKLYYNNAINFGEEAEIKINVHSDSKPIKAKIILNINGKKVAEKYSQEYTYKFKPDKIKEYIIEVIVEKDGIKKKKIGKITVIGKISEFLNEAESLKDKAHGEIDQAISITSEKAVDIAYSHGVDKATGKIMEVLKPVTEFAGELVSENYRGNLGWFAYYLGEMYEEVLSKALNEDVGIVTSMGFSNVRDYAEYMFGKKVLEPISDVKNKKNTIEENTEELKENILKNQERILSSRSKARMLFFVYSKPIERVVEDKSLGNVTIPLFGKRYLRSLEGIAKSYDFISDIKTGITVISIIIAVIIVVGSLIIAAKSTAMSFGALLPMIVSNIGTLFKIAGKLSKGAEILLATTAITLILSTPTVVEFVEDEHENAVDSIIEAIKGSGTSSISFVRASNTYILKPTYIRSSGYTVVVSPDGKILKVMKGNGYYMPRYAGKYKVFSMSHKNKLFDVVKSTTFNAKKPNVTLSYNYTLIGKNLTVNTEVHNFENLAIENMYLFLTVENSSGSIVYADMRSFTLQDNIQEKFNVGFNETDVYTVTATLAIMGIYEVAENNFLINVGNVSILDAVVEVEAQEIYSPLKNVTLNLTLKSSMPTDLEIVIPKLNYSLNTTVENHTSCELVLPKLTPDRYQLAIMAVKDGKILDADIVEFTVEAIDIAFLIFDKPKLYWSSGENITFNLTLTNFEDKPVDANVSVSILGPYTNNTSAALKVGNHYQVSFALPENGTYIAKAYATKEGYAIKNDEIVFIVGNMSRLQMVVNESDIGIYVRVFANGMLTPCNLKVISGNDTFNTYINGRILLNKTLSNYTIIADKMFYEPGVYVKNLNPVAIFNFNPTKPVVGESVIFNASLSYDPDGKIVKSLWDFGDGNWTEGEVVNHSYSKPGNYTVTLTVVDNGGVKNSTSKTITVVDTVSENESSKSILQPNLKVKNITTNTPIYSGNQSEINLTITNNGTENITTSFPVEITIRNASGTVVYNHTENINGLNAGENTTLTFNWTPNNTGNYTIKAFVDSNNTINESDENDNKYNINILVNESSVGGTSSEDDTPSGSGDGTFSGGEVPSRGGRSLISRDSYPDVTPDIKSEKIKEIVHKVKLIVGSEIDKDLSAKDLKTTLDLINTPIEINEDCILIGGLVANPTVKKYLWTFPIKVTNEYPGKHKGVIQKQIINGHTVILLAGSDRWGTKAAVEYFKTLEDLPDEPIFVEWKDGVAVKIERP
ncbi:right-handed parallel beta-helix repeat-containing protein [Methanothermococcus sp. SCGC AD-155-C09]|nr:right-handed parallel beta-helix repeat-containing protein [Methanothermococcus sp. SCGC AD-155-C09]